MKRPFIFAVLFVLTFAWLSSSSGLVSMGAPPTSDAKSKGTMLHLSPGTLWIDIDPSDKPFHLKNLGQKFDAESLIEFLNAFVNHAAKGKGGYAPTIIVEYHDKRDADGQRAFDDCLEQLVAKHNVTVIYLPPPTGYDPDADLRKFFEEFKQQREVVPSK